MEHIDANPNAVTTQTRQNFVDAFWQLYETQDISQIRVQQICDLAGYHRNSFYRYFTDIYDLLGQIEDSIIDEIVQNTDIDILCESKAETVEKFLCVWQQNSRYLRVLADERKGSRFQIKMTQRLKHLNRNMFVYSDDAWEDDYIWEHHMTGTVAALMYCIRQKDQEKNLGRVMSLLMDFRNNDGYPLRYREK